MGCCFSSDDDKNSQDGEPNERTTLLGNPVSSSSSRPTSEDYRRRISYPLSKKAEEAAHNRILRYVEANLIDISHMNSQLEQQEYLDRAHEYSHKIATTALAYTYLQKRPFVLVDLPAPEKGLAIIPIPWSDLKLLSFGHPAEVHLVVIAISTVHQG
ncbi:ragulator complex protein LAMTOR1-like isoform X2 [Limulus polyphemus]|uniref:Ragulator complex protein LAMTOR1 n=1 Tax=Limulus polyphemus TaxID=6850 RepID=A0ABM1S4Q9_LIMPO|nr:ragulator complex protein LAMTOR1-like isoform X2 [Limulus polyphemus]